VDQAIIKYYRQLLRTDFEHAGGMENPTVFIEAIGEKMVHCGNSGNYMELYLKIEDQKIAGIKYQCSCEPAANVAVEVLCTLAKDKSLDEALNISEADFYKIIGSNAEELNIKVSGLLEMLREAISRYKSQLQARTNPAENIQW
jgi:NifU-like protein involved in Fe-S cluster formation